MILDEPLKGADFERKFTTRTNRKTKKLNARYQTWLQSITCKGKIELAVQTVDAETTEDKSTTDGKGTTEGEQG